MTTRRDRVTLKGMCFHARVGVLPHEAELPQPVEIDLTVEVDEALPPSAVVDYTVLYTQVARVLEVKHIRYMEEIAESVALSVLGTPGVCVAHVAVRKPHVALPGPLAYAEVSLTRPR